MQGKSFKSIIETGQEPETWKKAAYYRYWMHLAHELRVPAHFGIRSDRYKLIFFYGHENIKRGAMPTPVAWEFYDLESDPQEMTNQYNNPEYEARISQMKRQLKITRAQLNETDEHYPTLKKIINDNWNS